MSAPPSNAIWTLGARDSALLEVIRGCFALSDGAVREEIWSANAVVVESLASQGVRYADLRNALVPRPGRHEAALLFDRNRIPESWYGHAVAHQVLGSIEPKHTGSFLAGDLLCENQHWARQTLNDHVTWARNVDLRHTSQLYCVYVTNLSPTAFARLLAGVSAYDGFVGHAECSYSSTFKDWMSTTLVGRYVKLRDIVVGECEDDVVPGAGYNLAGWPWDDHGCVVKSIAATYFGLFLTYKIERRVLPGDTDPEFALIAISGQPSALDTLKVSVEEAKHAYLCDQHGPSLARAQLIGLDVEALGRLLTAKLTGNYLYNLRHIADTDTSLFNIVVELPGSGASGPTRLTAALEYQPDVPALRLVTLF